MRRGRHRAYVNVGDDICFRSNIQGGNRDRFGHSVANPAGACRTWKLVSWVRHTADGRVLPYDPVLGLLFYDQFGNMSVQIRADDPTTEGRPPAAANGAQRSSERYVAYFGTYTVDEGKHSVTHHIRGNRSQAAGRDAVRLFELQGNQLTLRAQDDGMTHALVWDRAR